MIFTEDAGDQQLSHRLPPERDTYDVHPALADYPVWLGYEEEADNERLLSGDTDDPTLLSDAPYVLPPDAIHANGTSHVAWVEGGPDAEWRVIHARDGQDPGTVVATGDAHYAAAAVAATEETVYVAAEEIADEVQVVVYERPVGGDGWTETFRGEDSSYQPRLATARDRAGLVFSTFTGRGYDVHYRDLAAGTTTVVCDDGVYNQHPDVAFDDAGHVWVAWTRESERMNPNREHYLRDHVRVQTTERFAMVAPWYNHQRAFVRRLDRDVYTRLGSPEERNAHYPRLAVSPGGRPWVFTRYLAAPNRDLDVPKYGVFAHRGPAPDGPASGHSAWDDPRTVDGGYSGRNCPVGVRATPEGIELAWTVDSRPVVGSDLGEADSGEYISDTAYVRTDNAIREGDSDLVRLLGTDGELIGAPATEGESAYAVTPRHVQRRPLSNTTDERRTVETADGELELVYGNLHRHSTISMCGSDFDQEQQFHYRFARDVTGEAFTAVTDHAEDMVPYDWHESVKYAEAYDAPGSFVAFPAYEFTGSRQIYSGYREDDSGFGHAHVIQREPGHERRHIYQSDTPTVQALLDAVDSDVTMPIPHHPADMQFPFDWNDYDETVAPVVELYQDYRGASEFLDDPRHIELPQTEDPRHYLQPILDDGVRVGFTSSGDHYSVSFAGVYVAERTRDAVFEALQERRCYATTGAQMKLEFRADEKLMGSVVPTGGSPIPFEISVEGNGVIEAVEFVANGEVVREWIPDEPSFEVEFELDEPDTGYYYVRVHRDDDHMAWSTPVWLE
ncbi:DUF3604 domain-containing protein [Halobellus ordinarius]|uniref:DUF3604 domain-containing protein n=1 Tax=Halobellus ordinarius TaxID=3075120 RepID=UPI00288085DE|nr:DUF3604 domain-containing protein [Halobellus sp. ZY16]